MSDNNEPLDLATIEARLTSSMLAGLKIECFRVSYDDDILIGYEGNPTNPTSFEIMTSYSEDFFRNAPTDIIALIAEVKRLRVELAEAKRTQVKDGGRGQLRPFPEPDREE